MGDRHKGTADQVGRVDNETSLMTKKPVEAVRTPRPARGRSGVYCPAHHKGMWERREGANLVVSRL